MMLTKQRAAMAVAGLNDQLKRRFGDKVSLYLFGSVARGDFGSESDIDVLVLFDGKLTREVEKEIMEAAFNIELEDDVVFGLMIETKGDWQTPLFCAMPIHKVIDEEGVLV
ncbi:MAG TPA: nucleotidyltransferase domain-containing protein [Candidatus Omnitrophota bacterium]|nr:nucleotidyltransferase domain-containing protein [Candidatus Omnitrophota bacterium]